MNDVIVLEMSGLSQWRTLGSFSELSEALAFIRKTGGIIRSFGFWQTVTNENPSIAIAIETGAPRPRSKRRSRVSTG